MINLFIGVDEREMAAAEVCRFSAATRTYGLRTTFLEHRSLRQNGLFWREWKIDARGQYWDWQDGKPFSTQFSHSRFLTPFLAQEGWAIFCDSDFLFLTDLHKLVDQFDPSKALMCVKHNHRPANAEKMDHCIQSVYPRKNWSSLMAFNLDDARNKALTVDDVNTKPGSWLHQFSWLADEAIGAISEDWNYLVGHSDMDEVNALHFTDGGPWLADHKPTVWDKSWLNERARLSVMSDAA